MRVSGGEICGIVGGLGPETSARFYMQLIANADAIDSSRRPEIVLWNAPIQNSREASFIRGEDQTAYYVQLLQRGCEAVVKAGATFIVIPCNSAHIFLPVLRSQLSVPLLSIVEESGEALLAAGSSPVGLMGTRALISSGLYQEELARRGISCLVPSSGSLEQISSYIQLLVQKGSDAVDHSVLCAIGTELKQAGAERLLLGCTDLQLTVQRDTFELPVLDSMKIFADAVANKLMGKPSRLG